MRLAGLIPSISAEVVAHLEDSGIRTDADLLFTPTFHILRRLPPGTLTLRDLTGIRSAVAESAAVEPIFAKDLLISQEQALGRDIELRTGDGGLDVLLQGLGGRKVTEISGDRGSGKTTLALNIILHHLAHSPSDTAIWVDTTGDFSPSRANQILSSYSDQVSTTALERLQVSLAFDVETVSDILYEAYQSNSGVQPRFIVIDPITPLLGPILSAASSYGHALMTDFMRQLRSFSHTYGIAVLVINNATLKHPVDRMTAEVERKPALGPTFTFLTDTTLWLSCQTQHLRAEASHIDPIFNVEVLKSRFKASGACHSFGIHQGVVIS